MVIRQILHVVVILISYETTGLGPLILKLFVVQVWPLTKGVQAKLWEKKQMESQASAAEKSDRCKGHLDAFVLHSLPRQSGCGRN